MLRATVGTVKATSGGRSLALLLACACFAGCYWQRYPRLVETHLDLLLDFAAKLQTVADDGDRVPPEGWGEFTYPLERARDFARIAAQRFADRPSLAAFREAMEAYAALVADPRLLDRPDAPAEVARLRQALEAAAGRTRAALEREGST